MRKVFALAAAAAIVLTGIVALAGNTQVSVSKWKAAGKTGYVYGRSDGVFQEGTAKSPYAIENGQPAKALGKGFYHDFTLYEDGESIFCRDQSNYGACAGNAALTPCLCQVADGNEFIWMPLLQQDIEPDMDAGSLDIGADQTDNDGAQLIWGFGGASGKAFVIGQDPAFHMCTEFMIADITGIDGNIMAGFLKLNTGDAFNADFEALDVYAGIGILGTAAAGVTSEDVTIKTELDANADGTGDGVVTTDTTDDVAEGAKHKLCTYVSAAGVVTYTVNGSAPTATAAYTFEDDASVVPFITYLHTNDVAGEIDIYTVDVSYD